MNELMILNFIDFKKIHSSFKKMFLKFLYEMTEQETEQRQQQKNTSNQTHRLHTAMCTSITVTMFHFSASIKPESTCFNGTLLYNQYTQHNTHWTCTTSVLTDIFSLQQ